MCIESCVLKYQSILEYCYIFFAQVEKEDGICVDAILDKSTFEHLRAVEADSKGDVIIKVSDKTLYTYITTARTSYKAFKAAGLFTNTW